MRSLVLLPFILYSFASSAQAINKHFIGTWINYKLDERIKANQPFDSLAQVFPQFILIKNSRKIEIQDRFEQKVEYTIQNVKTNVLTASRVGLIRIRLTLDSDTITMYDNYNGKNKFIRYKNE